uniref:Uncharacterized protein n=1 Tax=Daphnia galeata TaxID=27404 RepID=A0A8J2RU57_9CRUS|nr:unnamed protein product [Daphnia galeata]
MPLDFPISEEFKRGFLVSVISFFTMAGQQNFVPTFLLNPAVILQNHEAIVNGFSAIKQFLEKSIWSPLGAECYSLFVWRALGLSESQSEVLEMNVFPWEEETYLW